MALYVFGMSSANLSVQARIYDTDMVRFTILALAIGRMSFKVRYAAPRWYRIQLFEDGSQSDRLLSRCLVTTLCVEHNLQQGTLSGRRTSRKWLCMTLLHALF